jgi:hypothetical protein
MTGAEPCRICGSSVTIIERAAPRRHGEASVRMVEERLCTGDGCRSNTRARRMGDTV